MKLLAKLTATNHIIHHFNRQHCSHYNTQKFYASLDLVRDKPGEPVKGTFHHLLDFLEQNEDNTGRCTNNLDGLPPHPD